MADSLTIKHRPRSFADTVGQRATRAVLRQMVKTGRIPPALLLSGPRGTGKTTTARILAAALNCTERTDADPCGTCPSCKDVFSASSVAVLEIDAASNGLVADIRALREQVQYSVAGDWRVVLLDEAHSMSKEAFNALLKTLEEPPPSTVFVLITTEPGRILETVRSRCMGFDFTRMSIDDIVHRLISIGDAENANVTQELARAIAERADGGMRDAVMLLDQCLQVGISTPEQLQVLTGDEDYGPTIFGAIARADLPAAYAAVDAAMSRQGDPVAISASLSSLVRELFILHGGGTLSRQGDALAARQKLVTMVSSERLFAMARVLWDLRTKVRLPDRDALELAVVMLVDAAFPQRTLEPSAQPKVLDLAGIRAMAVR